MLILHCYQNCRNDSYFSYYGGTLFLYGRWAIKAKAEILEKEFVESNHCSDEQMHLHHRWAQATTVIQVAISLAAISLLTRKRWLEWLMWGLSGVGVISGIFAILQI